MLVGIVGVHGVGKTTIAKALNTETERFKRYFDQIYFFIEENLPKDVPGGKVEGEKWFLKHYQEIHHKYREIYGRDENPLIIEDNTHHNIPIYGRAFSKLGWVNWDDLNREVMIPYRSTNWLPYDLLIILDSDVNTVLNRIAERDRLEKDKWREGDRKYVELIREGYKQLVTNPPKNVNRIIIINNDNLRTTLFKIIQEILKWIGKKS